MPTEGNQPDVFQRKRYVSVGAITSHRHIEAIVQISFFSLFSFFSLCIAATTWIQSTTGHLA